MTDRPQNDRHSAYGEAGRSMSAAGETAVSVGESAEEEPPGGHGSGAGEPGSHDSGSHDPEEDRRRDASGRPPRKGLSDLLAEIAADTSNSYITIADLMLLLRGRARAALILIFAFPNALPAIPGTSSILGLPLLYLTFQMMMGRMPWLPKIVAARGMPRERFAVLIHRLIPYLHRTERMLRPRWRWLTSARAEKVLGILCLVLAIILTLPVPLGNMLPAFAICLIALGLLEKDGLWVILGVLTSVVALVISLGVIYAMARAAIFLLVHAFG